MQTISSIIFCLEMTIFLTVSSMSIIPTTPEQQHSSTNSEEHTNSSISQTNISPRANPNGNFELNKFVLSIINAYDENDDQHLNIIELKRMLTNETIMRKVEKIFNKKLQSKPSVMHQSTRIVPETSSRPQSVVDVGDGTSTPEIGNKKNTNLKSVKKKKIIDQIEAANEDYEESDT